MAKLKCGRLTPRGRRRLPAVLGRHGLHLADNPISQAYRDSRLISIGGGADEIMLGIICKLEGTLPGKNSDDRRPAPPCLLRHEGGVLHVTLNRPETRNAMSLAMVLELRQALAAAEADGATRVHRAARRRRALLCRRRPERHGRARA